MQLWALALIALVLIAAPAATAKKSSQFPKTEHKPQLPSQTVLFSLGNAVNGGFIASLGPTLSALERSTGLGQAELGRAILQHRMAKMLATFLLPVYARLLQQGRAVLNPKQLLFLCMALSAASAVAIICGRSSALVLQLALALAGFCYGTSDSLMTLLTIWQPVNAQQRRTDVAWLNAGFTTGALITPMAVSAALRLGASAFAAFGATATIAVASALLMATCLVPADPPELEACLETSPARPSLRRPATCTRALRASRRAALPASRHCLPRATASLLDDPCLQLGPSQRPAQPDPRQASLRTPPACLQGPPSAQSSPVPGKAARQAGATRWALRDATVVGCMCIVLFSATGCEHTVATWLPSFGVAVSGIPLTTTSLMCSVYWTVNGLGRLLWAIVSPSISSGWPVLAADGALMVSASERVSSLPGFRSERPSPSHLQASVSG